jgi:hypothetical protein
LPPVPSFPVLPHFVDARLRGREGAWVV